MTHVFNLDDLARCLMSDEESARFKATATRRECIDEDQLWRIVCYVAPDGAILVDEMIRL